jgi:subfamily B ATP-binding cassette protein MsbA
MFQNNSNKETETGRDNQYKLRALLGYISPYHSALALSAVLMVGESLAALTTPWFAGRFAESLLTDEPPFNLTLGQIILLWFLVLLAQALMRFYSTYLATSCGARVLANLSNSLYDHLQTLPVTYFHDRKRGDLLSLLSNDLAVISHFITGTLTSIFPMLLVLIGAFAMMAWMDQMIALLIAFLVPIFYLTLKLLGKKIRPVTSELAQTQADALAVAEENLGLLPIIKAFVRETLESERFQQQTAKVMRLRLYQLKLQALLSPALQLLSSSAILLILWVVSEHISDGQLSLPDLVSLLLYGLLFTKPVSNLANLFGQIQQARGASERLIDIFSELSEPENLHTREMPRVEGNISFKRVSFHYPDRPQLFKSLNLNIAAGETVAITGPNGIGKSTLLNLLMRFLDPTEGGIEIDGINIQNVSLSSLRNQIGLVGQHVLLVDGTIEENIGYGRPVAEQQDIENASKIAHAHDFISKLPDGYMTRIGEQGVRLSGGQKQRIALARAILCDPVILLLDEATAMFDAQGEQHMIQQCREFLSARTVIMITHRPASLSLADRVVKL